MSDITRFDRAGVPRLSVDRLDAQYRSGQVWHDVLTDVSFQVNPGEVVAMVGESGSGKSTAALATAGLLPLVGGRVTGGEVRFNGEVIRWEDQPRWEQLRQRSLGMVFQQPTRSLNPAFTIGHQVAAPIRRHLGEAPSEARHRALQCLEDVGLRNAAQRLDHYPHQFSGGECQRIMLAIAISCEPALLIADEPTTALDVRVQKSILELLLRLRTEHDLAILLITHDLGVVEEVADRVVVFYAGEIIEQATLPELMLRPRHPYSQALLECSAPVTSARTRLPTIAGSVPRLGSFASGCRFSPRCPVSLDECETQRIESHRISPTSSCRCIRVASGGGPEKASSDE